MGTGASAEASAALRASSDELLTEAVAELSAPERRKLLAALDGYESGKVANLPQGLRHIASRHCTRRFDSARPVPRELVDDILEGSRSLPTSANTQPWTVIVTQGATRDRLSEGMLAKFDAGNDGESQFAERPTEMTARMKKAVDDYAQFCTEQVGAKQGDKDAHRAKYRANFQFFGAPVHVLLCAPREQCIDEDVAGIFLDMGSLLTAILLGAHSHGLGGKPQFSVARYHEVCREVLAKEELPDDLVVICGVSLGWPEGGRDPRVKPEPFPPRLGVDVTTNWASCDAGWLAAAAVPVSSAGAGADPTLANLIQSRHCSHSLDTARQVPKDVIAAILEAARNVPSSSNSQPWSATVIQGESRDKLSKRMLEEFDGGKDGAQTYKKYSAKNTAQMQKGKDIYGYELYEQKHGLARDDKEGRRLKYRPNYEFWGAPVLLLLRLPKNAVAGSYIDFGSYMYAILVGMHSYGLGGKPLGSIAKYTDTCREMLGAEAMPEDEHLVCGLCIGWPTGGRDPRQTPDFFPTRLTLEETCRWNVDGSWRAAPLAEEKAPEETAK